MKTLSGGQLAGGNTSTVRAENDFYATDPQTVELFLNELEKIEKLDGNFWECACGTGNISEVLKKRYPNSKVFSSDLIDRGYGIIGVDFLNTTNTKNKMNTIITNPPFSLAQEFIEKGLELSDKYVIMLCKIQLLEGVKRKNMFASTPLQYVFVHTTRQATWKNGMSTDENGKKWATTMCLAWFVWNKNYTGEPIIKFI